MKSAHVPADRLDGAREIRTGNRVLRLAQSGGEAHDERRAGHEDPVTDVDRCGVDADQDLVVADLGLVDIPRLQDGR